MREMDERIQNLFCYYAFDYDNKTGQMWLVNSYIMTSSDDKDSEVKISTQDARYIWRIQVQIPCDDERQLIEKTWEARIMATREVKSVLHTDIPVERRGE